MRFGKFEVKIQDCFVRATRYTIYLSQHSGFATGGRSDAPQVRRRANA